MRHLISLVEAASKDAALSAAYATVERIATPDILRCEEAWRGGIADLGDSRRAADAIRQAPGYDAYQEALGEALGAFLGYPFTVYRLMPRDVWEAWGDGQWLRNKAGSTDVAVTLSRSVAEGLRRFPQNRDKDLVIVEMKVTRPEAVVMRGKIEEQEIVVDAGWLEVEDANALTETVVGDPDDAILADLYSRADVEAFREWVEENYPEDMEEWDDERLRMSNFAMWLDTEFSVDVRDGLVHFWRLDRPEVSTMIGDNFVALYHFTSSVRVPSIRREGLVSGKRSVNWTKTDGVFLTTETSGPAVNGYIRGATKGNKGHGVRITVKMTLDELSPDPDDADIRSGATQFVCNHVPPDRIVSVDRA